ncbi:carbonic anhydrase [Trichoderma barbatum]
MTAWGDLLERNRVYSETAHVPRPDLPDFKPSPIIIFCCIDLRIPIQEFLQISPEEAFVIRNCGGRVKPNLNDLIFMEATQEGALRNIIVIHHTDCGFTYHTDQGLKQKLKTKHPHLAGEVDLLCWDTFGSSDRLEESVREDVQLLKTQIFVRKELRDSVKGYIYDIKNGKLKEVL